MRDRTVRGHFLFCFVFFILSFSSLFISNLRVPTTYELLLEHKQLGAVGSRLFSLSYFSPLVGRYSTGIVLQTISFVSFASHPKRVVHRQYMQGLRYGMSPGRLRVTVFLLSYVRHPASAIPSPRHTFMYTNDLIPGTPQGARNRRRDLYYCVPQ